MATAEEAEKLRADPAGIAGQSVLLTTNSTADYAVRACLAKWSIKPTDVTFVNLQQAQIITAIISGNGALAGVWAPNTYTLGEKAGAETLCTGADAGATVPGALVVRPDFAKEHPDDVVKFLAVFLRGVAWEKAHHEEAVDLLMDFYSEGGIEISDKAAESEFELRPTFTLDEQLALLDRAAGPSKVDGWLDSIAAFMGEVGTLPVVPEAASFVDPSFMKKVADDPELSAFARRTD
jgi:ABC-type nitrate/sulfonate/bicarbonate transport system substrate-binding protein